MLAQRKPIVAACQGPLWKLISRGAACPPWPQALFHGGLVPAQGWAGGGSRSAWISRVLISPISCLNSFIGAYVPQCRTRLKAVSATALDNRELST